MTFVRLDQPHPRGAGGRSQPLVFGCQGQPLPHRQLQIGRVVAAEPPFPGHIQDISQDTIEARPVQPDRNGGAAAEVPCRG